MRMKTIPEDDDNDHLPTKSVNHKNSILEEKFIHQSVNQILGDVSNNDHQEIKSLFFSGDWGKFFEIWNSLFPMHVKTSIGFRILTLKLRVHFAILPIRILELAQLNDSALSKSTKAERLLRSVADEYISVDDKKDGADECTDFTMSNMKQLESFLTSYQGQNLILELKGNPLMTLIALPYISHPQDDVSVREIFSIGWLENLIESFEGFVGSFYKIDVMSETNKNLFSLHEPGGKESSGPELMKHDDRCPIGTPGDSSKDYNDRASHNDGSRILLKRREIENWIEQSNCTRCVRNSHETKSTQTDLGCITNDSIASLTKGQSHAVDITHTRGIMSNSSLPVSDEPFQSYHDELTSTKLRLFNTHQRYRKLKVNFHNLLEDYQKMNEIAEKLTNALESSVRGQSVDLESISEACMRIFPNRFDKDLHKDIQTDSEDLGLDMEKKLYEDTIAREKGEKVADSFRTESQVLDYDKIKHHLRYGDVKTKLLLLQSLRQKLTSNQSEDVTKTVLEYSSNDVLGIHQDGLNSNNGNILSSILQPINLKTSFSFIQQMASRFLNTIASSSHGRTYLTSGIEVLNLIIKFIDNCEYCNVDEITIDMLLATLQKMSLRKQQRHYMIEANLVEWLIHRLSDENFRARSYRLEYSCALLMNLSLQSAARSRASDMAHLLVSTVINLLRSDSTSVLLYVNGSLQNFLLDDNVNNEAERSNLAGAIESCCLNNNQEIRDQLAHTLRIHRRECDEGLTDEDDLPDEDDGILDAFEDELEKDDPVLFQEELHGEEFLRMYYCCKS